MQETKLSQVNFWLRRAEPLWFPLGVFLLLRIVTAVAAVQGLRDMPTGIPDWFRGEAAFVTFEQALPRESPLYEWLWPWQRFDTAWYLKVAIQGYPPNDPSIVFPPLYPLLIRMIAPLVADNFMLAALIVSNLACLLSFVLLFRLILRTFDGDHPLARAALLTLAAFPWAFFLLAGYTEALFLCLSLGAFLAALDRRWLLAGACAFLAALTRFQGIVLCAPLAYIAYTQRPPSWDVRALLSRAPAVFGAALGVAAFTLYVSANALGSLSDMWANEWRIFTRPPWESIIGYLNRLSADQTFFFEDDSAAAALFILLMGVVALVRRMRLEYPLLIFGTLFLLLIRYSDRTQFDSISRYAVTIFPCFIAAGLLLRRWPPLLLLYVVGGGYWQLVLIYNFTHWGFVG